MEHLLMVSKYSFSQNNANVHVLDVHRQGKACTWYKGLTRVNETSDTYLNNNTASVSKHYEYKGRILPKLICIKTQQNIKL